MIARIYGKCDGADIVFSQYSAGRWATTVPASTSGQYIVELWAEDTAGNTAYFATVEFTFDPEKLCMSVRVLDIGSAWSMIDVQSIFPPAPVNARARTTEIAYALAPDIVKAQVTRCERCGR